MPQHSPEYPMLRNYLELVSELPWKKSSMEMIDISKAKEVHIYDFYFLNSTMKMFHIFHCLKFGAIMYYADIHRT